MANDQRTPRELINDIIDVIMKLKSDEFCSGFL
jgi:hypothetical protein